MERVKKIGGWVFEIKQVRAIKTPEYGQPFTANALITIVNGQPSVENLLSISEFTRNDFKDIQGFLSELGFKNINYQRFNKDGKPMIRENQHD